MTYRRPAVAAALVAMVAAWPPPLQAEEAGDAAAKRQAETELLRGVKLLKEQRYAEALARFKDAYGLVPSPLILYDFGLAQLGLGDNAAAVESFENFLTAASDAPQDKRRKATAYRDDLRNRVAVLTLNGDVPAASVRVDDHDLGEATLPRRLYLQPGSHELFVRAGDVTQTVALTCTAGQPQTLSMALATRPPVPAPPVSLLQQPAPLVGQPTRPTDQHGASRTWPLLATAVGAASLGVGLTFGLLASNQADEVTSESQNRSQFTPGAQTTGIRDQRLEIVFLSVGTLAMLAGVGLYALLRHREAGGRAAQGTP